MMIAGLILVLAALGLFAVSYARELRRFAAADREEAEWPVDDPHG